MGRGMSLLSSRIVEQQILRFCFEHSEKILEIKDNYFLSNEGKALYNTLLDLYRNNVSFSDDNIVSLGGQKNEGITFELLKSIRSIEYDDSAWLHYRNILQKTYAKDRIQSKVLKEALTVSTLKSDFDIDKMQDIIYELQECINLARGQEAEVKTLREMFNSYQNTLAKRVDGSAFFDTGCVLLNSVLPTGFSPGEITTIFGSTGIGKSTYSLYLINRMVNKYIPCFYVSLEMSETSTMDRWMASRLRIPFPMFYSKNGVIDESILEKVKEERSKFERANSNKFVFIDETRVSSSSLEKMINQVKMKMQTSYMVVFVDLATMMEDFSEGTSIAYEQAMNNLHQMAKRTKVHLVLVVQAVQKSLENHRPTTIEGLRVFRPMLASIKNSSAIAERSRQVLAVYREHYYAAKFFPDDPLVQEEDDVMEVSILKCSNSDVGRRLNYLYDGGLFRLYPIPEDYTPQTATQMRQNQMGENDGEI
jgi:replicative DNA helicase